MRYNKIKLVKFLDKWPYRSVSKGSVAAHPLALFSGVSNSEPSSMVLIQLRSRRAVEKNR